VRGARTTQLNCTGAGKLDRFVISFIVTSLDSRSQKLAPAVGTSVTLFVVPA
jgi:hypothetical protein